MIKSKPFQSKNICGKLIFIFKNKIAGFKNSIDIIISKVVVFKKYICINE